VKAVGRLVEIGKLDALLGNFLVSKEREAMS
jgi:hypothetical protein